MKVHRHTELDLRVIVVVDAGRPNALRNGCQIGVRKVEGEAIKLKGLETRCRLVIDRGGDGSGGWVLIARH